MGEYKESTTNPSTTPYTSLSPSLVSCSAFNGVLNSAEPLSPRELIWRTGTPTHTRSGACAQRGLITVISVAISLSLVSARGQPLLTWLPYYYYW